MRKTKTQERRSCGTRLTPAFPKVEAPELQSGERRFQAPRYTRTAKRASAPASLGGRSFSSDIKPAQPYVILNVATRLFPAHAFRAPGREVKNPSFGLFGMNPKQAPTGIPRKTLAFHIDENRDWLAELDCGHQQHVRHSPPWTEHPWVTTRKAVYNTISRPRLPLKSLCSVDIKLRS